MLKGIREEIRESSRGIRKEGILASLLHLYDFFYLLSQFNFLPYCSLGLFVDTMICEAGEASVSLLDVYLSVVLHLYCEALS